MAIEKIHSYLVHPSRGVEEQPDIGGVEVPGSGRLGAMLARVFDQAPTECSISIVFRNRDDGAAMNDCRDEVVAYITRPTLSTGRKLAKRLQAVTTHRSGLGLLFLIVGSVAHRKRLVVSRFPADQGVIAEEHHTGLNIEFLERVFMKSAFAYKSALYEDRLNDRAFWQGMAVDRQISGGLKELSDYWIREFLVSELSTTSAAGTRRIAVALRSATQAASTVELRHELIAAATILRNQHGRTTTGDQLIERLGLSEGASDALRRQLPRVELMGEAFEFDREEFDRHLIYRMVELDTGAVLIAEDRNWGEAFAESPVPNSPHKVKFTAEGKVVDEKLRKSK
jgi:hypothetical protein